MSELIGIVDLGSNSARLVIFQIYRNRSYNLIYEQKEAVRLSEGSTENGLLKKGDVLVYNHDNKIIVPRVIKKSNNGETISFKTKGDYNNAKDSWTVKQEDVIGIVKFRIRWIGMPTVALNELLNK